jgi:hypothetical protein
MTNLDLRAWRLRLALKQTDAAIRALGHGDGSNLCKFERGGAQLGPRSLERLAAFYRDEEARQARRATFESIGRDAVAAVAHGDDDVRLFV